MQKQIFGIERPVQGQALAEFIEPKTAFKPLPKPTGSSPFHLDLKDVLSPAEYTRITTSKQMIFHTTGDVGGVKNPADQVLVADHMEMQFNKKSALHNPSFYYILGDVVY